MAKPAHAIEATPHNVVETESIWLRDDSDDGVGFKSMKSSSGAYGSGYLQSDCLSESDQAQGSARIGQWIRRKSPISGLFDN